MSIKLENITYQYMEGTPYQIPALEQINLTIENGEFIGIMGRTGCGKTTLLQLIAGLIQPSSGRVYLDGEDINKKEYPKEHLREEVGMVFQHPEAQLFETTVEKEVAFGLKNSGLSKEEMKERVKQAIERMGFSYEDIKKESPLSLSGGEKRRIAIAGVLVSRPKFLLFDEPIAGLDPIGRKNFLELVKELNDEGVTILMISHNPDCLCEYAHRILVLEDGKLVLSGTPKEVFSDENQALKPPISRSNASQIAELLKEKGIQISAGITKYEELKGAIISITKKERGVSNE